MSLRLGGALSGTVAVGLKVAGVLAILVFLEIFVVDAHGFLNLGMESIGVIGPNQGQWEGFKANASNTHKLIKSALSISNNIPVIFPASSGCC